MSSQHDSSNCRFCWSFISWTCAPAAPVTFALASRSKRYAVADAAAITPARKKKMEQLEATICTYLPAKPAFDPKRVLLHRLFFIEGFDQIRVCRFLPRSLTINHWRNLG